MNLFIFTLLVFFALCLLGFAYAVIKLIVLSIQGIDKAKLKINLQEWGAAASYAIHR